MHEKKLADIEALRQLRELRSEVEQKKDADLPAMVAARAGADVLYRNLRGKLPNLDEAAYQEVVIEMAEALQSYARVDWWRNYETKRQMKSHLDDYLYDEVKQRRAVHLTYDDIDTIIELVMTLAENNHALFRAQ